MRKSILALAATAGLLAAGPALAHPRLLSTSPAANGAAKAPRNVQLTFSEGLMPQFSGAELSLTSMPGMSMKTMQVPVKAALGAGGKILVLTPARALVPGTYRLDWHVVSRDTHRVKGSYSFRVG